MGFACAVRKLLSHVVYKLHERKRRRFTVGAQEILCTEMFGYTSVHHLQKLALTGPYVH